MSFQPFFKWLFIEFLLYTRYDVGLGTTEGVPGTPGSNREDAW